MRNLFTLKYIYKILIFNFLITILYPEKLNSKDFNLSCDMKSHYRNASDEIWSDTENKWDLEINQQARTLLVKQTVFYEGKIHNIRFDFSIINQNANTIIAISNQRTSIKKGPYITSLTLELETNKINAANIISDYRGVAFANYYGKCYVTNNNDWAF